MPYALTGTEITEAQLSELGGDFSGDNWREELQRVRTELMAAKTLKFESLSIDTRQYPNAVILSGPWPITGSGNRFGMTALNSNGFFSKPPGSGAGGVYHRPMFRDSAQFIFGQISGAPKVITEIKFEGYPIDYEEQWGSGSSDENDSTRTYRVRLATGGKSGRLVGYFYSGLTGPGGDAVAVDCNVGHSVEVHPNKFSLLVTIDATVGSGEIRVKLTNNSEFKWAGSKGSSGLIPRSNGVWPKWTHEETQTTPAIGINRRAPVLKITPPRATDLGLFHPDGDEVTLSSGGTEFVIFGNQAPISHEASPEILNNGNDNFRGVWLCKTIMVGDVGVGADLAPRSLAPTNASTSGAWGSVSTAIEYQIPRYHFRRNTNLSQPATPVGERPELGSCITSIFIRRAPVLVGDYYVENPATSAATVRLGHAKSSGTFESHQTVTLAAGEVQKYVELEQELWPILSHDYLLYDSADRFDVQAVTCSPLDLTGGEGSPAVSFPIMPWHYEDTERLMGV